MRHLETAFGALVALVAVAALAESARTQAPASPFRSIDGRGNNPLHPERGSAGVALLRRESIDYADGISSPAGPHRASARQISSHVAAASGSMPCAAPVTDFLWQWGQFLDHDLDLTNTAAPSEPLPIAVPPGDPQFDPSGTGTATIAFRRSEFATVVDGARQQINAITAFIDGSQVYGSDDIRARALRGPDGSLRVSAGNLLPFNTLGLPNAPTPHDPTLFLAGDVRASEQPGLTALHTLFVREHNVLAAVARQLGFDPENAYQIARALVGAELQAITYREFLPVLLGRGALRPYRGYRADVDPGIANSFSTAAFRLGHSLLPPRLLRLGPDGLPIRAGHLPLRQAFFAPGETVAHGIEPILRGLAAQRPQEVDTQVIDDVRNFLFGPPGAGGFDLAALNIQRGRDHGLPSYTRARIDHGLAPARAFADITQDRVVQGRLAMAYAQVDDVDLWVGGLAEDHVPGAMVGELFWHILVDQFERLRDGDRFWYEIALPPELVRFVEERTLARIIRANTPIGAELQDDVFRLR
jgi:hypothetical protein